MRTRCPSANPGPGDIFLPQRATDGWLTRFERGSAAAGAGCTDGPLRTAGATRTWSCAARTRRCCDRRGSRRRAVGRFRRRRSRRRRRAARPPRTRRRCVRPGFGDVPRSAPDAVAPPQRESGGVRAATNRRARAGNLRAARSTLFTRRASRSRRTAPPPRAARPARAPRASRTARRRRTARPCRSWA
jgi:hypothetical protein